MKYEDMRKTTESDPAWQAMKKEGRVDSHYMLLWDTSEPCARCGDLTKFESTPLGKRVCSTECLDALWAPYWSVN